MSQKTNPRQKLLVIGAAVAVLGLVSHVLRIREFGEAMQALTRRRAR